jgi:glycosyltransferase involved in cell wall biosynthesis
MRVLQIGKFYPPHVGGIESHLQTLCAELRCHADVKVIVANDAPRVRREEVEGVKLARMGKLFELAGAPVCKGMIREIRSIDADIIHLHTPNPTGALAYLASRHRGRLVVTWHSDILRQRILRRLFLPIQKHILRLSSAIVVASEAYLRTSRPLASYRFKCRVIPYGVRLEKFEGGQDSRVDEIRRRYGPRIVLAVGRMVYYKGFEHLIRAMRGVRGTLILIGDGPLRKALEIQSANLRINSRVAFIGELQDDAITSYYNAADVFVLPSTARTEAFGIVQIEAMASGTPVVNTSLESGVPTVSLHGITGLTVVPGDPDMLGSAINQLLDDPSLRALYGRNARCRAHEKFSAGAMSSSILNLYREVMVDGGDVSQLNGHPRPATAERSQVIAGVSKFLQH